MVGERLEIGGCETIVERFGKGSPVVVLHGEAGPRTAMPFMQALAKTNEVHVPHHVGWLDTRRGAHINTVRDVALVTQEYVERLKGPVTVIGLSFGGWVAAELTIQAPSLVSRLALISPIGVKIGGREDRDFADLYILEASERDALYYAAGRLPSMAGTDINVDVFLEKATADAAISRFCWQPYMHDPSLKGRLRRIKVPTLMLSGDNDKFVLNPAYYAEYAKFITEARHEVVAGAGHRIEEEEPQKTAERIAAFIAAK